jgi:7-cyano-7-deazaguanine reductase
MKKQESVETTKSVDILTNSFESKTQKIKLETDDFSCLSNDGIFPENGTLIVEYFPKGKTIDLSSFKSYLHSFRNESFLQEEVTKKIFDDLKKALSHNQITVTILFNSNSGIDVTCIESGVRGVIAGY